MSRRLPSRTTRDLQIGDFVVIDPTRKAEVVHNDDDGIIVKWFTDEGLGPYVAKLPHISLHPINYQPESAGQHQSWWKAHPDITGKYREF